MELQQGIEQKVRVGVLLAKPTKFSDPRNPVYGALLSWYYWRYIVKADETIIDILAHVWSDVPNCAGCYFLTLTASDTEKLGPLTLYIYDVVSLGKPIFMQFEVVARPHAQKG